MKLSFINILIIFKKFNAYKQGVPTRGAIILDPGMEHCLLLRGYKSNGTWGFPKGKVNENESDLDCAVREVYEETHEVKLQPDGINVQYARSGDAKGGFKVNLKSEIVLSNPMKA